MIVMFVSRMDHGREGKVLYGLVRAIWDGGG